MNKKYFDLGRKNVVFNVHDRVWVTNHPHSSSDDNKAEKLYPKWIGPFTILEKHGDTYILDLPSPMVKKRHVEHLKPYFERVSHHFSRNHSPEQIEKENTNARTLRSNPRVNYRKLAGYK
jgi:hypothetical protein